MDLTFFGIMQPFDLFKFIVTRLGPKMTMQKIHAMTDIRDYPKYRSGHKAAGFLPMSQAEMKRLGWDECDIILVTGDAYIDHPSFCTAIVGRYLESFGFRVGVISQPDWHSRDDFMALGRPRLFFGVTAGNMDSMINHYTADRKIRTDDAYTPGNVAGKRPDRAVTVYSQRIREAYKDIPVIIGGIEASLRRIAHYDYWSDTVRNSVLADSKADILVYGNGERPMAEIAARLASGEPVKHIKDVRGTAVMVHDALPGWSGIDMRTIERSAAILPRAEVNPYNPDCTQFNHDLKTSNDGTPKSQCSCGETLDNTATASEVANASQETSSTLEISQAVPESLKAEYSYVEPSTTLDNRTLEERIDYAKKVKPKVKTAKLEYILMPSAEKVKQDKLLYAQTAHIFIYETNPECARALMQKHGERYVWVNPPAFVLTTPELDYVYALPFMRIPHPAYKNQNIPAYEMIKTSLSLMRGCFGGCSFCSIVAHEGKRIQSRSEDSVLAELEEIKDKTPGFTGVISDLGGPSANMYKLECLNEKARKVCRRSSCLYPEICSNLNTDHGPLIELYRRARSLPFIKKILVASGVRIDLALRDKRYIKELIMHHVGGYLKIAPEHIQDEVLRYMLKPGVDVYYKFKELFESYSQAAGKKQYLIPYFMASHPGSTMESMIKLALWLKKNGFRVDQVQNFYPTPMAGASAMYYTGVNPYKDIKLSDNEAVFTAKGEISRRTQKAILRYHDPVNFKVIREVLRELRLDMYIGRSKEALVPPPDKTEFEASRRPKKVGGERANNGGSSFDNRGKAARPMGRAPHGNGFGNKKTVCRNGKKNGSR